METSRWQHVRATDDGYLVGTTLVNCVHAKSDCSGVCVMHNPTEHNMSTWPLLWRNDRKIVERLCQHGVGHPDPDQWPHWQRTNRMYEQVHGCCGCCVPS